MAELYKKNYKPVPFRNEWEASFGQPELTGSWLIWGASSNGKTSLALQLCKYFAQFGYRVAYNSLEEGASLSMKEAFIREGMAEVKTRIILLDQEPLEDLTFRLEKRKSPDVIVIDSLQYTGINYTDYKELRAKFRNKLFIFISHADGKNPSGRVAARVKYDAFVKIWVEGYRAYPQSRYGGGEAFVIWPEGANKY